MILYRQLRKTFQIIRRYYEMRKLLYDCYYGKTLVKTVATQKKAKEWKATNPKNFYKIRLEKITTL